MICIKSDISGKEIRRIVGMILLFAFMGFPLFGQGEVPSAAPGPDSLVVESAPMTAADSARARRERIRAEERRMDELGHSPKRAMYYSLALPGLGQAYNDKYLKIPIVYGALGGVGYWAYLNRLGYLASSEDYTNDPNSTNERYLRIWRRRLEMSIIAFAGVYALQVLDAYVDAYLFHWDVNPDLSVRMEPTFGPVFTPSGSAVANYGLSCRFTF
jgi:hypothetical protein